MSIKRPKAKASSGLAHGAHLLGMDASEGKSLVIYLSPQALLGEGKAIRGGVPVCWPWFGPSLEDAQLPMHGFVRNRFWKLESAARTRSG